MKKIWILLVACLVQGATFAQTSLDYTRHKNFYFLSLLQKSYNLDIELKKLDNACADVACHAQNYKWNEAEIAQIGKKLAGNKQLKAGAVGKMRTTGYFERYKAMNDEELVKMAWEDAARGINQIIDTYALGKKGRYPKIDSASYDVRKKNYNNLVNIIASRISLAQGDEQLFFMPSLSFAMDLLEANNRDEAGRLEPLNVANASAEAYIPFIQWSKYPYALMLVPGAGNDLAHLNLSAWGKIRLKIAAEAYHQGLAPLIVVSGGYVHPFQTPYCEAVEMKQHLMKNYNIPEKAILIEPHARHTTTNFRNAARIVYKTGIPAGKTMLCITDQYQSAYIESDVFTKRNMDELGYLPFKALKRKSIFFLEFLPAKESLHLDNRDPLDP